MARGAHCGKGGSASQTHSSIAKSSLACTPTPRAPTGPRLSIRLVPVESPISQRWDVGIIVPYFNQVFGDNRPTETSFGDMVIENRFLVHETKDLTVSFNFNIETPTGDTRTGNGQTVLIPYFAFYKDLGSPAGRCAASRDRRAGGRSRRRPLRPPSSKASASAKPSFRTTSPSSATSRPTFASRQPKCGQPHQRLLQHHRWVSYPPGK